MHPTETEKAHTAEPWIVEPEEWSNHKNLAVCAVNIGPVAIIHREPDEDTPEKLAEDEANAKRIVACVNSCTGIPDPATAIPALREALNESIHTLEWVQQWLEDVEKDSNIVTRHITKQIDAKAAKARAALALLKGGGK